MRVQFKPCVFVISRLSPSGILQLFISFQSLQASYLDTTATCFHLATTSFQWNGRKKIKVETTVEPCFLQNPENGSEVSLYCGANRVIPGGAWGSRKEWRRVRYDFIHPKRITWKLEGKVMAELFHWEAGWETKNLIQTQWRQFGSPVTESRLRCLEFPPWLLKDYTSGFWRARLHCSCFLNFLEWKGWTALKNNAGTMAECFVLLFLLLPEALNKRLNLQIDCVCRMNQDKDVKTVLYLNICFSDGCVFVFSRPVISACYGWCCVGSLRCK